eukprot:jgi/Ulvmu1/8051/UM004_0288.1
MDETCDLEQNAVADGFEEGRKHGVEQGRKDGRALGVRKGLEMGQELGFMLGCIKALQKYAQQNPEAVSSKHLGLADEVRQLVDEFPTDPQDLQLQDKMSHVRSRFKVLVAGVKILQDAESHNHSSLDF